MRVVILEDNPILAEGLGLLLNNSGFEVVAVAGDADEFAKAVAEHDPDITVVDVRLPPTFTDEGLRAAIEARRVRPGLPVLVFSQYVEEVYAAELLAAGSDGVGYLLKDRVSRVDEFLEAVRRVAAGGTVLDPEVVSQLMVKRSNPLERLTPREHEVLALMAEGLGNAAIAEKLVISEGAVHKHVGNVFLKLDLPPTDSGHRRVLAVLAHLGL
ncbi:LuxR family two component transcriptional regulator [Kribbella orskensis]|uniref:LuxR family two component transcriptional regulator n=1 Tax=Kribbella orskensis TaxID=2512216 RepID=A0ABY2BFV5_9ACTN|nr:MULTISPECIES: response regulator transcription factor [Kribbella]TCN37603.1 LuxR family two component transcriptional regulator [Kribbella sp. VKM Ac-2500]TCO18895.1 LuxR family two component transcriptional regulator [Kribbella orskensis]